MTADLNQLDHEIDALKLFDAHEHLVPPSLRLNTPLDFTYFLAIYNSSDLVSSGMDNDVLESIRRPGRIMINAHVNQVRPGAVPFPEPEIEQDMDLQQKWDILQPFWQQAANTTYAWSLRTALQDLFGIPDINSDTLEAISEALRTSNQPDWYRYVLQERAGIEDCVVDYGSSQLELDFLHPALRFDRFFYMDSSDFIRQFEQENDISITSFEDLTGLIDRLLAEGKATGMAAIKCALAYRRTLKIERWTEQEARQACDRLLHSWNEVLPAAEIRPLQDTLMHHLLDQAAAMDMPMQVHTGMQSGNGNELNNSDPTLLCSLLLEHPQVNFLIMHAGFPFTRQAAVMAKTFPNAYIDLVWVPLISPSAAVQTLDEQLEMVPMNKIIAFGGDHVIVEGAYAAAKMTRNVVKSVLKNKVVSGTMDMETALTVAGCILNSNGREFFHL